jgi:5'(3')-deoxyribonucleotidase
MSKKIIYIDLDGVLVDLEGWIRSKYGDQYVAEVGLGNLIDRDRHAFLLAPPIEGAVEAFQRLAGDPRFDVYLLSTAPWHNVEAWKAKRVWVEEHLGKLAKKRLILTHHKNLMRGDILIDDRDKNGAAEFEGEVIKFGTEPFEDWTKVLNHIIN